MGATAVATCTQCGAGGYTAQSLDHSCGADGASACDTWQTSTLSGNPASNGVDAKPYSNTHTSGVITDTNPWWRLDFGVPRDVQGATLWNTNACCQDRLNGANIWVGNNDTYNGTGNQKCFTVPPYTGTATTTFACTLTGRYFFVQQPNLISGYAYPVLSFAELQVWGSLTTQSVCTACDICANCASGFYSTALAAQSVATCTSCARGTYGPATQNAFTWSEVPWQANVLENVTLPSSWDLSFEIIILDTSPTQYGSILRLYSSVLGNMLEVRQHQGYTYMDITAIYSSGVMGYMSGTGALTDRAISTWTKVTFRRRWKSFQLFYNDVYENGYTKSSSPSDVSGVNLMVRGGVGGQASNCSIRNVVYSPMVSCLSCAAGSYAATAGSTVCTLCSAGLYSTTTGATASSTCVSCAAGTYGIASGSTTCVSCAAGTYSTALGATSPGTCLPCTSGTFGTALGATS